MNIHLIRGIIFCLFMTVLTVNGQVLMDETLEKSLSSLNLKTYLLKPAKYPITNPMDRTSLVKRIEKLEEQLRKQKPVNGSVGLMFNSFDNFRENKYQFGGEASLDIKEYPYQLRLTSDIQAIIENGKVSDRVSDLAIDFDFHPSAFNSQRKDKDPLRYEMYVFLSRNDNSYLGVENRFETGTGLIVGWWGKKIQQPGYKYDTLGVVVKGKPVQKKNSTIQKHLTGKGAATMSFLLDSLGAFSMSNHYEKVLTDGAGNSISDSTRKKISDLVIEGKSKTQLNNISKEIEDYIAYTRKTENRFRIAMLFGVNYEYEESYIKDSISTFSMDSSLMAPVESREFSTIEDLPIVARFYGVLRPSISYTNGRFEIYARSYLKLPLNNFNSDKVVYEGNEGSMASENAARAFEKQFLYDFRINSIVKVSYSTPLNRKKSYTRNFGTKFEVSVSYNFLYDNAPRRTWVYYEETDSFDKLRAPRLYSAVKFGFKFTV